jgi:hypothetical protein
MTEKLLQLTTEDMKNGYSYNHAEESYVCNICGKIYQTGEIFEAAGRYFEASRMVEVHVKDAHGDAFGVLVSYDKKYTGLTDHQKELLELMYSGLSDNEIAKKTGVAPATVRHQKFMFRERAKQAKLFLSIYELAAEGALKRKKSPSEEDEILDIHTGATMVDDRYVITKAEEEQILSTVFSSLSPLKLKVFSSKEKKKIVILKKIAGQLTQGKRYTEKELNEILKDIYEDFATMRRYLIEYGFMERTNDCREYWLK